MISISQQTVGSLPDKFEFIIEDENIFVSQLDYMIKSQYVELYLMILQWSPGRGGWEYIDEKVRYSPIV